jgi:hypothetical protein
MKVPSKPIRIGWARTDITPDRPVFLAGQFYERVSQYVHDPITATALALDNGTDQAVLVSLDMVYAPLPILAAVRRNLADEPDLDVQKISVHATHTHTSYCIGDKTLVSLFEAVFGPERVARLHAPENTMTDQEVRIFLTDKLTALIRSAWRARTAGGISLAQDYAAVAFNRRPIFRSGETIMYGVCSREDFVRLEGPSDHTADLLYTWDPIGRLTGVVVNIPCPAQVMELHCFVSADYWDAARSAIREKLGPVNILPMCGAAGDQNPLDLIRISKHNAQPLQDWGAQKGEVIRNLDLALECRDIGDRIADAVLRGYRKAYRHIAYDLPFVHALRPVELPIRQVSEAEYQEALALVETVKRSFSAEHKMQTADCVPLFAPVGVILRWQEQQETTTYAFDVHLLRIGRAVLATNPFELFTEYGMRIKARSPADQTFIAQLSNGGKSGYLPTELAVQGGSYSSKAASTTCGPEGGDRLVEETLQGLADLW